jgi:hypothetical protein
VLTGIILTHLTPGDSKRTQLCLGSIGFGENMCVESMRHFKSQAANYLARSRLMRFQCIDDWYCTLSCLFCLNADGYSHIVVLKQNSILMKNQVTYKDMLKNLRLIVFSLFGVGFLTYITTSQRLELHNVEGSCCLLRRVTW